MQSLPDALPEIQDTYFDEPPELPIWFDFELPEEPEPSLLRLLGRMSEPQEFSEFLWANDHGGWLPSE